MSNRYTQKPDIPARNHKYPGSLELYLRDISYNPIGHLSSKEEIALSTRIRKGDAKARNRLVSANYGFVIHIATGYSRSGLPFEELISAGNLGLLTAAEKFDGKKGFKFISYAVWWIEQSIRKAIYNQRMVKLSTNREDLLSKIRKLSATLQQAHASAYNPLPEELAKELGVTEEQIEGTISLARYPLSLDANLNPEEGNDKTLLDILEDTSSPSPDASITASSTREEIEQVLAGLSPREADILKLYFGWNDEEPLTLEEIGLRFKLTRERIRQIKEKALKKLRKPNMAERLALLLES
ncbi:MAG TPA: RNA polymerase sigma factor RpoD/SigA [Candidatus Nanoarchaeia archaeon]|nr:RNA polymerase sigma factor RpoD/SigA [Candidatus Nanoarchaeia archaeon]